MGALELVVFDLDGTLVDSDAALVAPFVALGVRREEVTFGHVLADECARLGITVDDYLDHFDYAIDLIGEDHVTFATDWFDGKTKVNWATPWYYPEVTQGKKYDGLGLIGFRTRAELPNVVDGMLKRNYSAARIEKLLGGNFIRVLKEVWK